MAFDALVDAIKDHANPKYYFSTMEIDPSTDLATIAKIKEHCMNTLDLVDI
jgi:hypothetical protein